jgi:ABC-type branched-subunit amino acid transport system ATPase component
VALNYPVGEQQMLAIARAFFKIQDYLIMDEPTEGLAPVIVDQVAELLVTLAGSTRNGCSGH